MKDEVDEMSAASRGSQPPIGFAVMGESGQWEATRETLESAEELAAAFSEDEECGFGRCYVVPLYRQEPPTDVERDAIRWAADTLCVGWEDLKPGDKDRSRKAADTLRRMLERLG